MLYSKKKGLKIECSCYSIVNIKIQNCVFNPYRDKCTICEYNYKHKLKFTKLEMLKFHQHQIKRYAVISRTTWPSFILCEKNKFKIKH